MSEKEGCLDPHGLAHMMARGGTVQELTGSTTLVSANQVYRIWRRDESLVLKIYGSDARERREHHALAALDGVDHLPRILDRGITDGMHWTLFEDAGRWNLESLPENPRLAHTVGEILATLRNAAPGPLSNLSRGIDQEWVAVDFDSTVRRLDRYRARVGVDKSLVEAALGIKPPFASAPVVSHTDTVARNFVVNDAGHVTLISWEWATLAPPEWDVTRAVWSMAIDAGPAASEAVIRGYGRPIDPVQMDRWIVYHTAQTLVMYAERHGARPEAIPSALVDEFRRAVLGSI